MINREANHEANHCDQCVCQNTAGFGLKNSEYCLHQILKQSQISMQIFTRIQHALGFLFFGVLLVFLLPACERQPDLKQSDLSVEQFLAEHWPKSLAAQGNPPDTFSKLEASLAPEDCGVCHVDQFSQWKTALHSHTMGPGIEWQLQLMDQQQGNKCLRCHAPLAEQKAIIARQRNWPNKPESAMPSWLDEELAHQGVVCAACHVRRHQRFGPPAKQQLPNELPHNGFTQSKAFQDSRFCATCHQHKLDENPPRVNGKLQVDTFRQWQQSPQAQQGVHCQTCHMPDRQHLWRGIHDAQMTTKALTIEARIVSGEPSDKRLQIDLSNTGAGHHFPTYLVPKVEVVALWVNSDDHQQIEIGRYVIGWWVDVHLKQEQYDTRIAAGETKRVEFAAALPESTGRWQLQLRFDVDPREQYIRTFKNSLATVADKLPDSTLLTLQQAVVEAESMRYSVNAFSAHLQADGKLQPIAK